MTAGRVLNLKDRVLEIAPGRALITRPCSSVAVNGVCLTGVRRRAGRLIFDLGQETLEKTDLGRLKKGGLVNLETPLRLADGIDGHIVLGHVDAVGRIARRKRMGNSLILTIAIDAGLAGLIVPKGSLAVEGVSLTINEVRSAGQKIKFSVCLIPETLRRTNLGAKRPGDPGNIETDYIAKLFLNKRNFRT